MFGHVFLVADYQRRASFLTVTFVALICKAQLHLS